MASCDFCAYNEYDEEDEAYYCSVNMDEDDTRNVPFTVPGMNTKLYGTRCNLVPFS